MSCNVERFVSKYHDVGRLRLTIRLPRAALRGSAIRFSFQNYGHSVKVVARLTSEGSTNVSLALNLNVVAVCTVFAFVSAILLGAF